MFNLDAELRKWKKNLRKKYLEDGYVEELEGHLLDEFEKIKSTGEDDREAFDKAVNNVGTAGSLNGEFRKSSALIQGFQESPSKRIYFALLFNYLKISLRNIFKNSFYSIINVSGYAVGIACAALILLWVQDELRYDSFHKDVDRIYRVYSDYPESDQPWQTPLSPDPLYEVVKKDYPEAEKITRGKYLAVSIKYGEKKFKEETLAVVDGEFFDIFSRPLSEGSFEYFTGDPYSALITQELAGKLFGNKSAIGETITLNDKSEIKIVGVFANYPLNSQFSEIDLYLSYKYLESLNLVEKGWIGGRAETYIKLKPDIDKAGFEQKLEGLGEEYSPGCDYLLKLQPYKNIHLYSLTGKPEGMYYVYMFSIIALFILVMACINFMNLSTARSSKRAKEVGLRKVIGASRWQLIKQFYSESFIMTFASGVIAVLLVFSVLPLFNDITGKSLGLYTLDFTYILLFILLLVITGFTAGSYPALLLSSFTPAKILKRESEKGLKGKSFRRFLVIVQFSLAIGLVLCSLIVHRQLELMQTKSLGFDKENVIYLSLDNIDLQGQKTLKNEMKNLTGVAGVSIASDLPSSIYVGTSSINWEGKDPGSKVSFTFNSVDESYFETFGIDFIEGSNFYGNADSDINRFILNEKAAKIIGEESAVGKRFSMWNTSGEIVGVVKNFHNKPLNQDLEPILFTYMPFFYKYLFVKIKPYQVENVLSSLEDLWQTRVPGRDFEYKFLEETLNERYKDEKKIASLFEYFMALAIFISLLGLVGLSAFNTQQRVKEIGVRKVLGASVVSILNLVSREFILWIIISNIIAWPLTFYFMNRWLEQFAFRVDIGIDLMFFVGILAIVVSLSAVIIQSLKTVFSNPVNSLRIE